MRRHGAFAVPRVNRVFGSCADLQIKQRFSCTAITDSKATTSVIMIVFNIFVSAAL